MKWYTDEFNVRLAAVRALAVTVLVMLCASALGEPPSSAESESSPGRETVTIETQKQRKLIEHQINTFVASITMPTREEALLRWHRPVCPAVTGLSSAQDEFVLARLSQAIIDAGAPLAPENCAPNFLVLAAKQPEDLLKKWWARSPRLFNTDHGIGGIQHFLDGKTPIRAWYNAELGCGGGAFRVRGGKFYHPAHCAGGLGSRLTWDIVRAITSVIVIVDLQQVPDLSVGQLTDYATLIGLAQIRESADPGVAPTILHLFANNGGQRPDGLSSWDAAFLKALYNTNADNVVQVSQVEVWLDHDLIH